MSTTGLFIYGIPLHFPSLARKDSDWMATFKANQNEIAMEEEEELRFKGLLQYYDSDTDNPPSAFGLELANFDTTNCFLNLGVDSFHIEITQERKKQFQDLWHNLSEQEQTEFSAYGEPRLFILWAS